MAISQIPLTSAVTGVLPDANAPSGSVIQVVQGTTNVRTATTSTSFVNTNLTASITPISSSSRIVVFGQTQLYTPNVSTSMIGIGLKRDSTLVWTCAADSGPKYYSFSSSGTPTFIMMVPFAYTDSPATTSSTTYTVAISSYNGASVEDLGGVSGSRHTATIILMEIAV